MSAAVIVIWVICAITGAMITESKGRGPWPGALLGLILGLIGVLVAALLPRRAPGQQGR